MPVESITWRLKASEPAPMPELKFNIPFTGSEQNQVKGMRPVYVSQESSFKTIPVYDRYSLVPGFEFSGPALIEEKESTVLVGPDCKCAIDEQLNLIMEIDYS